MESKLIFWLCLIVCCIACGKAADIPLVNDSEKIILDDDLKDGLVEKILVDVDHESTTNLNKDLDEVTQDAAIAVGEPDMTYLEKEQNTNATQLQTDFEIGLPVQQSAHNSFYGFRLANSASTGPNYAQTNYGRIEVLYNGQWGTVCDDGFGFNEATVICREMGFEAIYRYHPRAGEGSGLPGCGQGSGQIWLDSVDCPSGAVRFSQCSHNGWGRHDCSHSEDMVLECLNNRPISPLRRDGGWSSWSSWSGCLTGESCQGVRLRTRACNNPVPDGGLDCSGSNTMTETCQASELCRECNVGCISCDANRCHQCMLGLYIDGRHCRSCGEGCLSCNDDSGCFVCMERYHADHTGTCQRCGDACGDCSDSTTCDRCFDEQCLNCSHTTCHECKIGYHTDGIGCRTCGEGCYSCNNNQTCASCVEGCATCNHDSCTSCDRGYYERVVSNKFSCFSVPGGRVSCGRHHAPDCSECPSGHGEKWCRGDCYWSSEDTCISKPDDAEFIAGYGYYKYVEEKVTWDEANAACLNLSAKLVVTETRGEMEALCDHWQCKEMGLISWVWTSGRRIESEEHTHHFTWDSSGTTILEIDDELWAPGEPNNSRKHENHVEIIYKHAHLGLNDKPGSYALPYMCEFETPANFNL